MSIRLDAQLIRRLLVLLLGVFAGSAYAQTTWTLQTTATGWVWRSPSGSIVKKYWGVALVDDDLFTRTGQFPTMISAKYNNDFDLWAQRQNERLVNWGFNSAGIGSGRFFAHHTASMLPVLTQFSFSGHAERNDYPYHIKNLNHDYGTGMKCLAQTYAPSSGGQIDAYDPGLQTAYKALATDVSFIGSYNNNFTMFIIPEEGDDLYGLNSIYTHEDLGWLVASRTPIQPSSAAGAGGGPGPAFTYTDQTVYAKVMGLRDFLANRYGCIGSADPGSGSYCGASAAASALAALNAAWATTYTTWNTSDAGGLAGIASGTYASFGTGTGLLDENGAHILSATTQTNCSQNPNTSTNILGNGDWANNATILTDLHDFVAAFAATYAQKLANATTLLAPHAPIFNIVYQGPANVYRAMNPYFDGFVISPEQMNGVATTVSAEIDRIKAGASIPGGKSIPFTLEDYQFTSADSPVNGTNGTTNFPSRATLGAGIVSMFRDCLSKVDANGKYVCMGGEKWGLPDQINEGWAGGLVTADGDNPYDGSAGDAVPAIATVWQSNHVYTAPVTVYDGTNYEALSGASFPGGCASGGLAPAWPGPNTEGALTGPDGNCYWRNEGPSILKSEAGVPVGATIPSHAYGDMITPIAAFLLTNPGDPTVTGLPAPATGLTASVQ